MRTYILFLFLFLFFPLSAFSQQIVGFASQFVNIISISNGICSMAMGVGKAELSAGMTINIGNSSPTKIIMVNVAIEYQGSSGSNFFGSNWVTLGVSTSPSSSYSFNSCLFPIQKPVDAVLTGRYIINTTVPMVEPSVNTGNPNTTTPNSYNTTKKTNLNTQGQQMVNPLDQQSMNTMNNFGQPVDKTEAVKDLTYMTIGIYSAIWDQIADKKEKRINDQDLMAIAEKNVQYKNKYGYTLTEFSKAIQNNDSYLLEKMINAGINPNIYVIWFENEAQTGRLPLPHITALQYASANGNLAVMKVLLEHGAYVNVEDRIPEEVGGDKGFYWCHVTALHYATGMVGCWSCIDLEHNTVNANINNRIEACKLLLQYGADKNAKARCIFDNKTFIDDTGFKLFYLTPYELARKNASFDLAVFLKD